MFGKRTNDTAQPRRAAPPRRSAGPAARQSRSGRAQASAPQTNRAARPAPEPVQQQRRHSEEYYDVKTTVFNALIDTIDLTQLAKLDSRGRARGDPRHRQRDHPDQERRDVDRRAGGAARGHLQRRARLRSAGAAAGARRDRRHHGQRREHDLHRGRRQGAAYRRAFRRQPAAHEHLPAHRQPGRPPRR